MKTKSVMLIAVSLGFGLIAAIGMSQVLAQKSTESVPQVEMVQVYVASKSLEIGDELKLDENLNVKKRPITDVPENAIRSAEELENRVAIQKVPKDVLIVADYVMDKHLASLGRQPPKGFRAFTIKTDVVDTHHNSIQAGDRIDLVGVFRVRNREDRELRAPSTFLKNIEVWQVNDKNYIGVDGEEGEKISTITVLLTPKQVEIAIWAQDIASVVRVVKTNREIIESDEDDFDLASLTKLLNDPRDDESDEEPAKEDKKQATKVAKSQELIQSLNKEVKDEPKKASPPAFKHKMTIYKGGKVIKYGFGGNDDLPTVISDSTSATTNTSADEESSSASVKIFNGPKEENGFEGSTEKQGSTSPVDKTGFNPPK